MDTLKVSNSHGEHHPQPPRLSVRTASSDSTSWPIARPGSLSSAKTTSSTKTMEEKQEALWHELNEFYNKNQSTIERAAAMDVSIEHMSEMDMAIDTFVETANVLLPGLVGLANIHPGLGVAVFAFAGVISLEMARRGNNRKVIAVNIQMQNMMCAMFQLRKLRHVHVEEPEREEEQTRLHRLIKAIADEIKVCGSDLDYYMDRKVLSKLINAKSYEHRFAFHVETFARRRSELQSTITAYIAAGVDAANLGIMEIQDRLSNMDLKLDGIMRAFRTLDTPRDREIHNFIESNGGAEQCITNNELLVKLLAKSRDNATTANVSFVKNQNLLEIRQTLKSELDERLDLVLAGNLPRFEKLLNVQNNNFERLLERVENQGYEISDHSRKLDTLVATTISILEEEKHIRRATAPIMSITFTDPVLQFIWNRMGLKGSVKAKTFVLTFRDHILGLDPNNHSMDFVTPVVARHPIYTPFSELSPTTLLQSEIEDQWALKYIDVSHVQPVIEAIDEDGSGFISVKEANTFAISRPKGWSFLRWVAYWAAGWHVDITNYRSKLYAIVQQIHQALLSVHPANRSYADEYMSNSAFNSLEALLRSVTPLPGNARIDSKLAEIIDSMSSLLESRLMTNLEEMSFVLESPATVNLVVGAGRVETLILPLLFLILNRHLEIMTLAQTHVLHEKELISHAKTLESIFSLFNDRINHLEAVFRTHVNQDVKAQFEKFAFGMFVVSYTEKESTPLNNTLLTFKDDKISLNQISLPRMKSTRNNTSILTRGLGAPFEFDEIWIPSYDYRLHSMEGSWTGQCTRTNNSRIAFQGFFQFNIDPIINGKITGKGETYLGEVEFTGEVEPDHETNSGLFNVELRIDSTKYADLWCRGQYDPVRQSISGKWVIDDDSGDFPPAADDAEESQMDLRLPCGRFYITRTPASVYRFRRILDDNSESNTFRSLTKQRWAFAIEAIRFQIQERRPSWAFLRTQTAERRKWMELTIRREIDKVSTPLKAQLSEEGKDVLFGLRLTVHPTVGRLYDSLSNYFFNRIAYSVGPYNCHSCDRPIIFARYQCIICMDDDFKNQVDLCQYCIDVQLPLTGSAFEHHISHSLVRSTRRLHDCELASIIHQARSTSKHVKSMFRSVEGSRANRGAIAANVELLNRFPIDSALPRCSCCAAAITLPCWICVICSLTYICFTCHANRSPVSKSGLGSSPHALDHPLLRVNDSTEVEPAELKANRLEKQLQDMDLKINNALTLLTQKIDSHFDTKNRSQEYATSALLGEVGIMPPMPLVDRDAEMVPAASIEAKIARSRTTASFTAKRKRIEEGALATRLEERMLALETKVDRQFGQLFDLMKQLVVPSPLSSPRPSVI